MSPPVAARRGEIRGTDASPAAIRAPTPWGCTRLFELRHAGGDGVPAQVSGYAAPPIRSDILTRDTRRSRKNRPSCELARQVPSTFAAGGLAQAGLVRAAALLGSGRRCLRGRAVPPGRPVAQHRPAAHQELARQRPAGLLLA